MATITLDYDAQSVQAQKTLDFILSMGIFKSSSLSVIKEETLSGKKRKIDKIFDNYLIDLSGFKFNRDEANNYD